MSPVWFLLILLSHVISLPSTLSLSVNISYSFHLPKELGVATPKSAKCCEYQRLPKNDTAELVRPTVFGIGTQKGGTTTLYAYFQRHPLLHGTTKELHYLDTYRINKTALEPYLMRWGYNRNSLKKGNPVQPLNGPLFEISPSYILVPFSACKAKHISPTAKFIVLLRDPTSRSFSGFSYTKDVLRRRKYTADFIKQDFLHVMKQGIAEVKAEPNCDFHSGSGVKTFNDCFGCVNRARNIEKFCKYRPFVTMTDAEGGYKCNSIGKEVILRGMYGAQLAWWFTLLPPSQFYILNSADFFKSPELMLIQIIHFLGLSQEYTKSALSQKRRRANKGHYRGVNEEKVEEAKVILKEYFKRPNLELYRLMNETGHFEFTPFEEELREMEHLDCMHPNPTEAKLCGMSPESSTDTTSEISNTNTPANQTQVEITVDPKDTPKDTKEVINKTVESSEESNPELKVITDTIDSSNESTPEVKVANKTVESSEESSQEVQYSIESSPEVEASKDSDEALLKIVDATNEGASVPAEGEQSLAEVAQVPIEAVQDHEVVLLKTHIEDDQDPESFEKKETSENDTPTKEEEQDHEQSFPKKVKIATFKPGIHKEFEFIHSHNKEEEAVRNQGLEKPEGIGNQNSKSIPFGWASDYYLHVLFACILAVLLVYGLCIRSRIPKQRRN